MGHYASEMGYDWVEKMEPDNKLKSEKTECIHIDPDKIFTCDATRAAVAQAKREIHTYYGLNYIPWGEILKGVACKEILKGVVCKEEDINLDLRKNRRKN